MRQIIILNNNLNLDGTTTVNYVYWISVPAIIQKANPSATSVVPNITQAELTALQNGSVIEQQVSSLLSPGFIASDAAATLIRGYTAQQNLYTQQGLAKNYAGAYYDGTSWFNLPA